MKLTELVAIRNNWLKAAAFNLALGLTKEAAYCSARADALAYPIRKEFVY